jgi:hypothetical protein
MSRINGIAVILYERVPDGVDGFNRPSFTETPVIVGGVIVSPVSSTEVLETFNLTGRKAVYQLGIPKSDTHNWTAGKKVRFFDADWRIIGIEQKGIEEMVPLRWNRKVQVERYE